MTRGNPAPEVYDKEIHLTSWGRLLQLAAHEVALHAPRGGSVLDVMCGTGYLLIEIGRLRPDLTLFGIDWDPAMIEYARAHDPKSDFQIQDATKWEPSVQHAVIMCTAGIHHLPREQQLGMVGRLCKWLTPSGIAIVGEPLIRENNKEVERRLASLELGSAYIRTAIREGAETDVLDAVTDILRNDLLGLEYKSSLPELRELLLRFFEQVELRHTWPRSSAKYGDYFAILSGKRVEA